MDGTRDVEARSERLELIATVLLGIATVASAWCTYEAQLWGSRQLRELATANALQVDSLRATEQQTRAVISDVMTFAAVLSAESRGDQHAAEYFAQFARPAFRPSLHAWLAHPTAAGAPPGTPFDDHAYQDAALKRPLQLRARAQKSQEAAMVANANGDLFVMRAVMFAISLFFLGLAGQVRTTLSRRLMFALGAAVLVLTLLSLTRLKRAGRPHAEPAAAMLPAALEGGDAEAPER